MHYVEAFLNLFHLLTICSVLLFIISFVSKLIPFPLNMVSALCPAIIEDRAGEEEGDVLPHEKVCY